MTLASRLETAGNTSTERLIDGAAQWSEHLRLIIEYDGRKHAEDPQQWLTGIFRGEELDQMRWRLVIVTSEGIYQEPVRTLERVRDALPEYEAVGIRRHFKPEWRRHFPTR